MRGAWLSGIANGAQEFENGRDAEDAVYDMHDRMLDGARVVVEFAHVGGRRGPPGGGGRGPPGGGGRYVGWPP